MRTSDFNAVFRQGYGVIPRDITIFKSDQTPIHLYAARVTAVDVRDDDILGCEFNVPICGAVSEKGQRPEMKVGLDLSYAIVWEGDADKWFDETGQFMAHLPEACIQDCSASGDVKPAVSGWRELLGFCVPRRKAIEYLVEFGCWSDDELNSMSDEELAERCLWTACNDIVEERRSPDRDPDEAVNWIGLIH